MRRDRQAAGYGYGAGGWRVSTSCNTSTTLSHCAIVGGGAPMVGRQAAAAAAALCSARAPAEGSRPEERRAAGPRAASWTVSSHADARQRGACCCCYCCDAGKLTCRDDESRRGGRPAATHSALRVHRTIAVIIDDISHSAHSPLLQCLLVAGEDRGVWCVCTCTVGVTAGPAGG